MKRCAPNSLLLVIAIFLAAPLEARSRPTRRPLSQSGSDSAALEKIYRIQDQRLSGNPYLTSALYHSSPRVVRAAILAHGRIGNPQSVEELAKILNRKNREMQKLAAFSLGQIASDVALKILEQQVEWQRDIDIRAALFLAIGKAGKESSVKGVARAILSEENPQILQAATHALGLLWSGESAKWEVPTGLLIRLATLAKSREIYNVPASFALARFKGPAEQFPTNEILTAAGVTPSPYAKALLCRVLGKMKSAQVSAFLASTLSSEMGLGTGAESAKALALQAPSETINASLKGALKRNSSAVLVSVLEAIAAQGKNSAALAENVEALLLGDTTVWVKENALKTLVKIKPASARAKCTEAIVDPSSPLRGAALVGLTLLGETADLEKVFANLSNERTKIIIDVLEAVLTLEEEPSAAHVKVIRKLLERADVGMTSQIGLLAEKYQWKDFASVFASVYPRFQSPDELEGKVAVLNALAVVGDVGQVPLLEAALREKDRLVVSASVAAIKAITGRDESSKIPLNSRVTDPTPSYSEISATTGTIVVIRTNRGDIHMKLSGDATVFNARFLKLVRSQFYDGRAFHRVVPNFVVQGGDPRGDGFGGPGFLVRDEVAPVKHWVGTVGLATAGKDTGGCQFFINLAPNLHLDGRYTVFAEVTKGMDVAENLEVGDKIFSVRVR